MPKHFGTMSAFFFPACGLSLLLGGSHWSPKPAFATEPESGSAQKRPASMNPTSRVILRSEYDSYRRSRLRCEPALIEAALYNQSLKDSDPSVLNGTDLPRHLPVPERNK